MAGELVPLVLIPRYTTYCGGDSGSEFVTIGMDVTQYQKAILQVSRGPIAGNAPDFNLSCQESSDQVNWSVSTSWRCRRSASGHGSPIR